HAVSSIFFFADLSTLAIYPLSLHDALPISDVAAAGRDLLYGLGRAVWARRDHRRRRLWLGLDHPLRAPVFLESADVAHDRRAGRGGSGRRWLLRMGAARDGTFLGLSRSVALARRFYLRHGDLSHLVRDLSRTSPGSRHGAASRSSGVIDRVNGCDRRHALEPARRSIGRP